MDIENIEEIKKLKFDRETKFQTWCNGVLERLNIHYYHISSKNKYVKKGIPDLLCWKDGKSFAIELKVGYEKPTTEQEDEIKKFIKQKIPVFVSKTPYDFINILKLVLT